MKPIVRIPLFYGLIAGALGFAIIVLLYYLNRHPFLIPPYMDSRILLFGIFLFFSLRELRDLHLGGVLYFWQGLIASFIFLAVFSIFVGLGLLIFAAVVPDFVESYVTLTIDQIKSLPAEVVDKIGKNVVESNLKSLPATNGTDMVELYTGQTFMIGFFLMIIMSVIVRRTPAVEKSNP